MERIKQYLFRQKNPLAWAVVNILFFGLAMIINFYWINPGDIQSTFILALTGMLMFSFYSAIMLLIAKAIVHAWNRTLMGFIIVTASLTLLGMAVTGQKWSDLHDFTLILKIMVLATIIFMAIAVTMRRIVEWAQKFDR